MSNFLVKSDFRYNGSTCTLTYNNYTRAEIINNAIPGRTLYECPASPQKINDISKLMISQEQINKICQEVLECPVCKQIYSEPVQFKKCLHTFCKKCFDKSVRTNNKMCPICRQPITSRRDATKNLDILEIIDILIPDKEVYYKKDQEIFEKNKKSYNFSQNKIKIEPKVNNNITPQKTKSQIDEVLNQFSKQSIPETIILKDDGEMKPNLSIDPFLGKKKVNLNHNVFAGNNKIVKKKKYNITKTKIDLNSLIDEFHNDNMVFLKLCRKDKDNKCNSNLLLPSRCTINELSIYVADKYNYENLPEDVEFYLEDNGNVSIINI